MIVLRQGKISTIVGYAVVLCIARSLSTVVRMSPSSINILFFSVSPSVENSCQSLPTSSLRSLKLAPGATKRNFYFVAFFFLI